MKKLEILHQGFGELESYIKEIDKRSGKIKNDNQIDGKIKSELDFLYETVGKLANNLNLFESGFYQYMLDCQEVEYKR